ncbi:MAG: hypothetical protein RLZZ618_2430 [Pseudomonadota bacterium]|jgi:hypothetical protein
MTAAPPANADPLNCPKCRYARRLGDKAPAGTCASCGLIFAKYAPRVKAPASSRRSVVTDSDDEPNGLWTLLRRLLAIGFLIWGITMGVEGYKLFPVGGGTPGYGVYGGFLMWGWALCCFVVAGLLFMRRSRRRFEASLDLDSVPSISIL